MTYVIARFRPAHNWYLAFTFKTTAMKYLKIHKLLWLLIVIIYALIELVFISVAWIIALVWTFKIPGNYWKSFHTCNWGFDNHWNGTTYSDDNIIVTIIRRYFTTF